MWHGNWHGGPCVSWIQREREIKSGGGQSLTLSRSIFVPNLSYLSWCRWTWAGAAAILNDDDDDSETFSKTTRRIFFSDSCNHPLLLLVLQQQEESDFISNQTVLVVAVDALFHTFHKQQHQEEQRGEGRMGWRKSLFTTRLTKSIKYLRWRAAQAQLRTILRFVFLLLEGFFLTPCKPTKQRISISD
jgi:hypothetical protein